MQKKRIILLFGFILFLGLHAGAIGFATQSLERLATYAGLGNLDNLSAGVHNEFRYKGHTVTIRVNQWNEIEHIGLLLFSQEMRTLQPLPVYDFLERYLLAQNAAPEGSDERVYMAWDKIHYQVGNAATAMKIDTTAAFSESHVDRHVYKVSWQMNGKKCLEMSFYMDYQLMTGCNAIELEKIMFSKMRREIWIPEEYSREGFPTKGTEYTKQGGKFISPMVRSDIYYTRNSEQDAWQLIDDAGHMSKTIANIMVSDESEHGLQVNIKMDKYGLRTDSATVSYGAWRQLCIKEGCTPYFGMKSKDGDTYRGTVFMVNETGGYLHLLSIDIPLAAIDKPEENVARAHIHTYIPLHNVSDNVFKVDEFNPIQ